MELILGNGRGSNRPEVFYVNLQPALDVLQQYEMWIGGGIDYEEYLRALGWHIFSNDQDPFELTICRKMLAQRGLPTERIEQIEHDVISAVAPAIDELMLEYDRINALFHGQIQGYRCYMIRSLFTVFIQWNTPNNDIVSEISNRLKELTK